MFETLPAQVVPQIKRPKLVVILVVEQLRGDYLNGYREDFKSRLGFNLFLKQGAYFPECYFNYANTVTASGHATLATGAYSDGHNIAADQWWEPSLSTTRPVSVTEDARYPLVGDVTNATRGASPRNELASTLGDEVVLSNGGKSRLFGVSLKDGEAILLSGHASRGAYWIDRATGHFITSTYWTDRLPGWVERFNTSGKTQKAREEAHVGSGSFYDLTGRAPAAVHYEFEFVQAMIEAEKIGQGDATDVVTISIPSTDFLGHQVGPDSPDQRRLLGAIDVEVNRFSSWLNKHLEGGLGSVWMALAGDHGVAPTPVQAASLGMPAATFSNSTLNDQLERALNTRLSPAHATKYILGGDAPYIQLNRQSFEAVGLPEGSAEDLVISLLPEAMEMAREPQAGIPTSHALQAATVRYAYTKKQIERGELPATPQGRLILNSFSTGGGWWVMLIPGMYQMAGHAESGTTHDSPYSYDRHVPLAFFGAPFAPGMYLESVEPTDMAVTLAALLGVNRPSSATGRVLTEALRRPPLTKR